ncbi:primosome, DnaD subunit [Clostridium sp. DL-VIII]|uniref:DnaD domain protein n=1 Tax=Clostridium sp. DL-VIII TaxID=641107 RepID=UPI00023AF950|nr:DnaD domain protein [Clostridium sp. DL-VIII]EHI99954.1 primosome, DnaD subunit [Clostridium sp. DL-VIII]
MLSLKENKAYTLGKIKASESCIQSVYKTDTQMRLDEISIDKSNLERDKSSLVRDNIKSLPVVVHSNNEVFKHFEKCGFIMSPKLMEFIAADIKVYSAKWLIDAATESMKRGKINYKYLLAILQNWKADGRDKKAALQRANAGAYKDFGDSVLDN